MKTLWPNVDDLTHATEHQRERLRIATQKPIGILGGNPGAGKSFTTAQVIKLAIQEHGLGQCFVACPTGKAAVRITELMQQHGLHGLQASTIHRTLGVSRNGHDQKGWGFVYNRSCPLPYRFGFVDEVSMLDTQFMGSLLDACAPGTHLLFIGDFAQLPPVGHGAPLRDMIAAGLPYGELTEVHRNGGDIVRACADLKAGRPFTPSAVINLDEGANLMHVEAARPAQSLAALSRLIKGAPADIDPVWDIQVLCATNEKSEVGRKNLNQGLQKLLNPAGQQLDGSQFRMGDKVICTTNAMMPLVQCDDCGCTDPAMIPWNGKWYECQCGHEMKPGQMIGDFVANGEIGKVTLLDKRLLHVTFDSPARTVRAAGEMADAFDLAYAVTCHKSQGSQWPVVVLMADDSNGADRVTSWEWWRTGLSRASKLCVTIGKKSTIDRQCRKSALKDRKTFLAELLKGGLADAS
jgi:exodeoxyribonuclease V alpha subunit